MAVRSLSGGDKLAARLQELAKKVAVPATLRVGFLEGATEADGTPIPMLAAIHEYGAPAAGIPPRPFFRPMIAEKSPTWGDALARNLVAQDYDAAKALEAMGQGIKGQLQASIKAVTSPPLKAETIARKGFAKPLVDTGAMLNSVDYEVKS